VTSADHPAAAAAAAQPRDDEAARLFELRAAPMQNFADQAGAVAAACHDMAIRFHQGGKLVVFGTGGSSTDAQHVAVEFVHPVIVGKRALPAISLTSDVATITGVAVAGGMAGIFAHQRAASDIGMLTIGLVGGDGGAIAASPAVNHLLTASSADPRIVKEMHVTAYHVLWELVHVFFEQPGILAPGVVA
jgi:D-sedoheptulose 7-phosphate isomerase